MSEISRANLQDSVCHKAVDCAMSADGVKSGRGQKGILQGGHDGTLARIRDVWLLQSSEVVVWTSLRDKRK